MNTVYVLSGISASGKSTITKALFLHHVVLSADIIRGEICGGNISDQSKNKEVFEIFYERLSALCNLGFDIVVDNTSLTFNDRNKIYSMISNSKIVLLYLIPDLELSLERNSKRERKVPDDVIRKQFARIQPPTEWEQENLLVLQINTK